MLTESFALAAVVNGEFERLTLRCCINYFCNFIKSLFISLRALLNIESI